VDAWILGTRSQEPGFQDPNPRLLTYPWLLIPDA
jgi:hypothetical protein